MGRFVSVDPWSGSIQQPISLHKYLYALDNPINFTDPSGSITCLDDECNWAVHPVTGEIIWRGSGTPPLPPGRYLYSEEYGWFDRSHLGTGDPSRIINDVRQAIAKGGDLVPVEQKIRGGLLVYTGHYHVSGNATMREAEEIALGIYMDWSMRFELWESSISIFGYNTAFAIEDLPSHYIGFYAAVRNRHLAEVFINLGCFEGTDQEPPRATDYVLYEFLTSDPLAPFFSSGDFLIPEIRNFWFTPRIQDDKGNWQNISWPDTMTITPIESESGKWEFRGAECQGYLCWATTPR